MAVPIHRQADPVSDLDEINPDPTLLDQLGDRASLTEMQRDELEHVLRCSPFIQQSLAAEPDILDYVIDGTADAYLGDGLAARFDALGGMPAERLELEPTAFGRELRRLRRREMILIAWRDLNGIDDTDATLRSLSNLADFCVAEALAYHEHHLKTRFGQPRGPNGEPVEMVVIGMGKLGGDELNYSSDIDLIFAYAEEGETDGKKTISNAEYFIRLGQRLIRSLDEKTGYGFVFRVDMRLRPNGDEGPLAMSFDGLELYYATRGREWERYAWIKARVIAGDQAAGRQLMDMLRPFVFRRYLDFGAFSQLREMKRMIEREMTDAAMHNNIKLGPGGIREIEFIGQLFQLLRGGREPALQARRLVPVLSILEEMGELDQATVADLTAGYDFLRRAENRLQMLYDHQTQTLPDNKFDQLRLAIAMGFEDWGSFLYALDRHRDRIHGHFSEVLRLPSDTDEADDPLEQVWNGLGDVADRVAILERHGFEEAATLERHLSTWRDTQGPAINGTVAQRLDELMPDLLRDISTYQGQVAILDRMLDLLAAILRRSVYVALLIEQPQARRQLVRLVHGSPWIASLLTQHPILLDELIDPETLYAPPDKTELARELGELLGKCPDDEERSLDELRRFKQLATLRVAAADVVGALPVMRVSDQLTWIAEVILEAVYERARAQIEARHGRPRAVDEAGEAFTPGLAIIGYGKLGGIELGYGSDLDLVFLHDSTDHEAVTDGERSIDNSLYFARLAQKIIHTLSIRTPAGVLYEVDTRLRPDGVGGLLVSSVNAFAQYQAEHAWVWEIQAMCRARFVAGVASVGEHFAEIRRRTLTQRRDPDELREAVVGMRRKMRANQPATPAGLFHLKRDIGGITDIEFLVQYLLLRHAADHPGILEYTDNIRQLDSLREAEIIDAEASEALIQAYRTLRDAGHHQALMGSRPVVEAHVVEAETQVVIDQWAAIIGCRPPEGRGKEDVDDDGGTD
ncbi:MAG: bifunctional [glutamate--ammonia ligase]-adenylyl-L-tyrosine phosphorylase/[glutamate--ammonia-ligase] adenylyltransferase [Guyparkeria sp.]|uniref:bifunctional [glutamate--ammonia ligase]-adenylyl-L-tyrosine phosphorylase/[glutamate--ammonia-ligase] adenylyltransferase n=1 Tax=Guyparkeria sp. TaxID=2035736 RepID=UPI00397C8EF6